VKVAVIDGQGGGIGSVIIKGLRHRLGEDVEIWALGTNAIATAQMMKAGANRGATGESPIVVCVHQVDTILGSISLVLADAFMGEMTEAAATAVAQARANKLLLPLSQENVTVVGVQPEPLPHLVDQMMNKLLEADKNV
jgi:hypothetical protein